MAFAAKFPVLSLGNLLHTGQNAVSRTQWLEARNHGDVTTTLPWQPGHSRQADKTPQMLCTLAGQEQGICTGRFLLPPLRDLAILRD